MLDYASAQVCQARAVMSLIERTDMPAHLLPEATRQNMDALQGLGDRGGLFVDLDVASFGVLVPC